MQYKVALILILSMSLSMIIAKDLGDLQLDTDCQVEFVIVIPSYNNEALYERNLDSVISQVSSNPFEVIYVNDCSTDRTGKHVDAYIEKYNLGSYIEVIHNAKNKGALPNIYHTIHDYIDDHKIVVLLDGDDKFNSDKVLLRLEQEYKNPDIWLTYGSAIRSNDGKRGLAQHIPEEALLSKTVRRIKPFPLHALRSFKAGLFKKIRIEDLLDQNGEFYEVASDPAYMYPMAEMCAPKESGGIVHLSYIHDLLYYWNRSNPISDGTIRLGYQKSRARAIKNKKQYEPIDSLD